MDILFEILIGNFLIHFLGINVRYYFLNCIGVKRTKEQLDHSTSKEPSQFLFNAIVGFLSFAVICFAGAYAYFSIA